MLEFIGENYTLLNDSPILIAAFTGVLYYKKYKDTKVRYFIYFLIYVFFVDFLGGYPKFFQDYEFLATFKELVSDTVFSKNYWWFTLFWSIGSVIFIIHYYQTILTNIKYKRLLRKVRLIFIIITIVYILLNWSSFFIQGFPFIKVFGALAVFLCIALYFIELLSGDYILSYYKSINFYISAALLIWWLVTTPVVFFDVYLHDKDMDYAITKALIFLSSNIFMYLTFAMALIFCKSNKS